ncbi:MAG: hypothetical protein LLG14_27540 [Nocardiaceae bacterium]|nr:hypothetical protein [Nocardiaceae bacterium]
MKVFIACEESGMMRRAFTERGHFAVSCDLLPARDGRNAGRNRLSKLRMRAGCDGNFHLQMDVWDALQFFDNCGVHFDLMIAHPPCTYLTRAGWHWVNKPDHATHPLKGEPRRQAAREAAAFFRALLDYPHIPRRAVENPRPIVHVGLPDATQYIQPWMFGDFEVKGTGLWLRSLPPLVPAFPTLGAYRSAHGLSDFDIPEPRVWKMAPGVDRARERSRTFPGIAAACADQWGRLG